MKFVSVSIDKDYQNWLKAVKEETSPWDSYIDAREKEGLIEQRFNLSYIPQNILVGKNGAIIDINISEEDLLNFCRKVK